MIFKTFILNKDKKIEFTETELKNLLNEIYEQGKLDERNNSQTITWTSPSIWINPPYYNLNSTDYPVPTNYTTTSTRQEDK